MFDVYVALGTGLFGFALRLLRVPLPPLLLGLILGGPIETYFLQAIVLYDSVWQAVTRPVCLLLVLLTVATVALSVRKELCGAEEARVTHRYQSVCLQRRGGDGRA